jgi:hypothetical protein
MEYRQVLALAPHNPDAERRLIGVREQKRLIPANDPYENAEHKKFKAYIASKWSPPTHKGCLVTRCRVFSTANGNADVEVVGQSGSAAHDRSAVSILKSALFRSPLLGGGIIDCACLSDGQERRVAWSGLGESNMCETSLEEQLSYCVEATVQWINKHVGALSL